MLVINGWSHCLYVTPESMLQKKKGQWLFPVNSTKTFYYVVILSISSDRKTVIIIIIVFSIITFVVDLIRVLLFWRVAIRVFFLTMSVEYQAGKWQEEHWLSTRGHCFIECQFFRATMKRNVWATVWKITT